MNSTVWENSRIVWLGKDRRRHCDVKLCWILARQRKRGMCRLGMCTALDELNAALAVCEVKVVEILVLGHLWTAFPVGTLIPF